MDRDQFRVVCTAIVTNQGEVLIGKKEEEESHPIGGEWHLIGGHVDRGEELDEAIRREVKEESGLDVEVHQIVDVMSFEWEKDAGNDSIRIVYHVEADSRDAEAKDDLEEVKWVKPENLKEELDTKDAERLENRDDQKKFLEKLEKMPAF